MTTAVSQSEGSPPDGDPAPDGRATDGAAPDSAAPDRPASVTRRPRRAAPSTPVSAEDAAVPDLAAPPAPGRWFLAAVAVVVLHAASALTALEPRGLGGDPGIQLELSRLTAEGAVPLRDFTHTWNVLAWYWGGLMWLLADGVPTFWSWLIGYPTARLLVGLAVVTWGLRARLSGPWLVALAGATAAVGEVPSVKYAIPALWLLVLVPVGRTGRGVPAVLLRVVLGAVTALGHVELAVVLGAGVVVFDLVGARGVGLVERLVRAAATPLAVVAALAAEFAVFARLGVPPRELLTILTGAEGEPSPAAHPYEAVVLVPETLLAAWWPVVVAAPFVPLVWRRLGDPGRLLACLGLTMSLIALRKADVGHVWAATTLLPATGVAVAHALRTGVLRTGVDVRGTSRWWRPALGVAAGALAVVALATAVVVVQSIALGLVLVVLGLVAGLVAAVRAFPAVSLGAGAALLAGGLAGSAALVGTAAEAPDDALDARVVAAAVADEVDRCVGPERQAWVIPEPLRLYALLDLENPTPYYLFWSGIDDEAVLDAARAGEVPAILVVDGFPSSVDRVREVVTATWTACAVVDVPPATGADDVPVPGHTVTIWTPPAGYGA